MKWPDTGEAPARLANRLLSDQDWARARLVPFAGRTFSLAVGPLYAQWQIADDGTLTSVPASTAFRPATDVVAAFGTFVSRRPEALERVRARGR